MLGDVPLAPNAGEVADSQARNQCCRNYHFFVFFVPFVVESVHSPNGISGVQTPVAFWAV